MKPSHYIIYVPGLGGSLDSFRRSALRLWNAWGVKTIFVPMNWESEKNLLPKQTRLESVIQNAKKHNYTVTLIGESAGSTIALWAAAKHNVRIVTLCGVNDPRMHIAPKTQQRAPALQKSLDQLKRAFETLDLLNVHTITPLSDTIVAPKHAAIKGAYNHRVISFGHRFTIILCLTVLSGYVTRLAKSNS